MPVLDIIWQKNWDMRVGAEDALKIEGKRRMKEAGKSKPLGIDSKGDKIRVKDPEPFDTRKELSA